MFFALPIIPSAACAIQNCFLYSAVSKFLLEARIVTVVHANVFDENRESL